LLLVAVAVLLRQRYVGWRRAPLMFDDEVPSEVLRFRLD
jgi:hypothetical protein